MRAILIVLDSVGVGAMPDAEAWGDAGSDTIGHVAQALGALELPNLAALGLGRIRPIAGVPAVGKPRGAWGRAATASDGKDTITGHWEMAGCLVSERFAFFPDGFPPDIVEAFERATGRAVLGNKPASGTAIIEELGRLHMATGRPIVYTSADSVFQVAAHEEVVSLETLYDWCRAAFDIVAPRRVARVIARPFVGRPGAFTRTYNRKDFALMPTGPTVMDAMADAGVEVTGVGKVPSIFGGRGFTHAVKAGSNDEIVAALVARLEEQPRGFLFANLVDFDSRYGHRRDPVGYGRALETFDRQLPGILSHLGPDDLLLLTADHGCDPTHPGSDHTREYVPVLAWADGAAADLGLRSSLADMGATLAEWLGVPWSGPGRSFCSALRGRSATH